MVNVYLGALQTRKAKKCTLKFGGMAKNRYLEQACIIGRYFSAGYIPASYYRQSH